MDSLAIPGGYVLELLKQYKRIFSFFYLQLAQKMSSDLGMIKALLINNRT